TPSRPSTTSSREGGRTLDSRLSTLDLVAAIGLVVLAVGLAGCGGGEPPAPTASRFEAVQATAAPAALERWCDVYTPGAGAPRLELPQVAPARAGSPAFTLPADRWVWLNLWATWCVPCKREMPLLVKWRDQLVRDGVPFELVFLSVDDTAEGLARFFGEHPLVAPDPSLRLLQPKSLDAWLKRYEPEPSGAVPVHLIAAPGGAVRCVRAGAIRDGDYATVRALMR
ncbi:MAG: TlpA family protein disulfide reductase, partial [Thermoanaerobaculaceae bacterium]|nr:TlpA family protein disulfide reductase [Thermoanaerobaculaceae bacterium]